MKAIVDLMKCSEHCPECGALLLIVPGGATCPACGFDELDPEERLASPLNRLSSHYREGAWFHLMDEAA